MAQTLSEMIAVMQAAERGETIQVRYRGETDWMTCLKAGWNWHNCEFRVKPKPREWWVNVYPGYDKVVHLSREDADSQASDRRLECIRVREVTEPTAE